MLKDRLSITVANLRPPNRKNKKRTKKRAVERFEGEVDDIVKNMMMITEYDHLFHSKQRRDTFVKRIELRMLSLSIKLLKINK